MITPKYFNPAAYFAPVPSQEFLASVCLVSFSPLVYFYVTWVYRGYSFAVPVYNDVFGPTAACSEIFLVVHWRPMGGLLLTFSSRYLNTFFYHYIKLSLLYCAEEWGLFDPITPKIRSEACGLNSTYSNLPCDKMRI